MKQAPLKKWRIHILSTNGLKPGVFEYPLERNAFLICTDRSNSFLKNTLTKNKLVIPFPDAEGNNPGHFYIEVQLRSLAMDSWASLEHQLKYKKDIPSRDLIVSELKRCADELASCDLSMQTIRNLIREEGTV